MGEFRMPSLGAEMEAGRLLTWYVEPGQQVRRGDLIAEVETDKADIDVEVFEDGIVGELLVDEGADVPVGTPLATILAPDAATTASPRAPAPHPGDAPVTRDAPEALAAPATPPSVLDTPAVPAPVATSSLTEPPTGPVAPPPIAPPALNPVLRQLARHRGVDLAGLTGTGPGRRITRADIERAATDAAPAAAAPVARPSLAPPALPQRPPRSSPYARRLAAQRGLSVTSLTGRGPGGALVAADVPTVVTLDEPTSSASSPSVPTPSGRAVADPDARRSGRRDEDRDAAMRRAIARAMARSKREIPHYYLGETVDVEGSLRWLEAHNAARPAAQRLLPAVLLLRAVARAAASFGELNGTWEDDRFHPGDGVHLGVAIARRGGGLLAPVIRDADARSLPELMTALQDLVTRTRRGGLRASELDGGTLTVSNLGDTGVETVLAVIQPPQVALVGAGAILERPWAEDGQVAARRCLHLTLAADHRASDGHLGGRFLTAIAEHLRRPEQL